MLRHEKTHMKHGDPLIRVIGTMCTCLHWWNPLVWLAAYLMNQDMEMFCDETVRFWGRSCIWGISYKEESKKHHEKKETKFSDSFSGGGPCCFLHCGIDDGTQDRKRKRG